MGNLVYGMTVRPQVTNNLRNRLYEVAEEIEASEPAEARSFADALTVVVEYADDALDEPDVAELEDVVGNTGVSEGIGLGSGTRQGQPFNDGF